ncbi:MAG: type II toxin-antitoxin system RelE/ParE family toxin [Deltaproteobacteria bacterium]|nr:type II toxin-antitoxin system RelE/ParE family toxin [Deltaproteobacteria bacterium]
MPSGSWTVLRYQAADGRVPFDEFVSTLAPQEKARAVRTVELLETFGVSLREPYAKHLAGTELWELRVECARNSFRLLYFAWVNRAFVLLNGFRKKSRRTPPEEIERAQKYLKDFKERSQ